MVIIQKEQILAARPTIFMDQVEKLLFEMRLPLYGC